MAQLKPDFVDVVDVSGSLSLAVRGVDAGRASTVGRRGVRLARTLTRIRRRLRRVVSHRHPVERVQRQEPVATAPRRQGPLEKRARVGPRRAAGDARHRMNEQAQRGVARCAFIDKNRAARSLPRRCTTPVATLPSRARDGEARGQHVEDVNERTPHAAHRHTNTHTRTHVRAHSPTSFLGPKLHDKVAVALQISDATLQRTLAATGAKVPVARHTAAPSRRAAHRGAARRARTATRIRRSECGRRR